MDKVQLGRRLGFLCSPLDDPRRIQLRQNEFLEAYRARGTSEDLIEIIHDLTKLRPSNSQDIFGAVSFFLHPVMLPIEYTHERDYPLQPRIRLPEAAITDRSF